MHKPILNNRLTVIMMPHEAQEYVKKRIPIKAIQINAPFRVQTLEGTMHGEPGDYLIQGIRGELYPCAKDIFEESYERYPVE